MGQEERAPPPLEATTDPRMQSKWTTHSTAKSVTPKKKIQKTEEIEELWSLISERDNGGNILILRNRAIFSARCVRVRKCVFVFSATPGQYTTQPTSQPTYQPPSHPLPPSPTLAANSSFPAATATATATAQRSSNLQPLQCSWQIRNVSWSCLCCHVRECNKDLGGVPRPPLIPPLKRPRQSSANKHSTGSNNNNCITHKNKL